MYRQPTAAIEIAGRGRETSGSGSFDGSCIESPLQNMSFVNVPQSSAFAFANGVVSNNDAGSASPLSLIELLPGEAVDGSDDFETFQLVLTNYRLCIISKQEKTIAVIPTLCIDNFDVSQPNVIGLLCKDGKQFKISIPDQKVISWQKMVIKRTTRSGIGDAFAWDFSLAMPIDSPALCAPDAIEQDLCQREYVRLGFDPDHFVIFDGNKDYKFTETYPERTIITKGSLDFMNEIHDFRFLKRFPAVVWRSRETNAVLLRGSQPRVGLFSWRSSGDEAIFEHVVKYMQNMQEDNDAIPKKVRIMDARSYAAAMMNRAKGGGFEMAEYYSNAETDFLGLPNIHSVRSAFQQLRSLLTQRDSSNYLAQLQATNWLQYLSSLLSFSNDCVESLLQGQSVFVHCSDGWDRTTQIVSFAKLMADEYYRTIKGFTELIRREWIEFGHKFADRNGLFVESTERSPIFLQWLDGVYQMMKQNPTMFQFNEQFLLKLVQHTYSGMFDAFLFNSQADAEKEYAKLHRKPISLWRFLGEHNEHFVNLLFDGTVGRIPVKTDIPNLYVWKECYSVDLSDTPPCDPEIFNKDPDIAVRPSSAGTSPCRDQPMQKSKSSESVNSLQNTSAEAQTNGLSNVHSESNGTLNTLTERDPTLENSMMTESFIRREQRPRSKRMRRGVKSIKELVDFDGLVKFYDAKQESVRNMKQKHANEMQKKNEVISNLRRDRSCSERTSNSAMVRDRMYSGEEVDIETLSLDRALSDVSLVDHDHGFPMQRGWAVNQDTCALCHKSLRTLAINQDDRPHHCRLCGRPVCQACSPNSYHDIHEGKGVLHRACVECYEKMSPPERATALSAHLLYDEDIDKTVDLEEELPPERRKRSTTMMHVGDEPNKQQPFADAKLSPQTVRG